MTIKQLHRNLLNRYKQWLTVERNNGETTVKNAMRLTEWFLLWLTDKSYNIDKINQEIINTYLSACQKKYGKGSLSPITINLRKFMYT